MKSYVFITIAVLALVSFVPKRDRRVSWRRAIISVPANLQTYCAKSFYFYDGFLYIDHGKHKVPADSVRIIFVEKCRK